MWQTRAITDVRVIYLKIDAVMITGIYANKMENEQKTSTFMFSSTIDSGTTYVQACDLTGSTENQYDGRKTKNIWDDVLNRVVLLKKVTVKQIREHFSSVFYQIYHWRHRTERKTGTIYTSTYYKGRP
jgi:hypothetical protein